MAWHAAVVLHAAVCYAVQLAHGDGAASTAGGTPALKPAVVLSRAAVRYAFLQAHGDGAGAAAGGTSGLLHCECGDAGRTEAVHRRGG